jgi:hypothetical protein
LDRQHTLWLLNSTSIARQLCGRDERRRASPVRACLAVGTLLRERTRVACLTMMGRERRGLCGETSSPGRVWRTRHRFGPLLGRGSVAEGASEPRCMPPKLSIRPLTHPPLTCRGPWGVTIPAQADPTSRSLFPLLLSRQHMCRMPVLWWIPDMHLTMSFKMYSLLYSSRLAVHFSDRMPK